MTYTIGVPWKPGCPHREKSWRYVHDRLSRLPARLIVANPDPFTRAGARNHIAQHATGPIIFHDADMLLPVDAYEHLADIAAKTGRMVIGFHQYRPLDQAQTALVIDAGADPFAIRPHATTEGWSVGGVFALTADAWAEVGGMDPRFHGWGFEDFAFHHAASLVLGPSTRLDSAAVHLWHPHGQGVDLAREAEGHALMARYTACTTVAELREVQRQEVAA